MSTQQDRIAYLLARYNSKTCTREEFDELFAWIRDPANEAELDRHMEGLADSLPFGTGAHAVDWEAMYTNIRGQSTARRTRVFRWGLALAAACVALAVGLGFFLMEQDDSAGTAAAMLAQHDVAPGDNRAVLRLNDGSMVVLEDQADGIVAVQGGARVEKTADGTLLYGLTDGAAAEAADFNTLEIPRKGQYKLVLPDGSKVWLNAESAITYPTAFTGATREVTLAGEAYFEVAHDARRPFLVAGEGYQLQVLGTHFNIMSYPNEPDIKITLVEGSVLVSDHTEAKKLAPGQQALISHTGRRMRLRSVDVEQAVAWQTNTFFFDNTPVDEAMRMLERWYDVDIHYKTPNRNLAFTGMISRQHPLSSVLRYLEKAGEVKFDISAQTVLVQ